MALAIMPILASAEDRHELKERADQAAEAIRGWEPGESPREIEEKKERYESDRDALREALERELAGLGSRASRQEIDRVVDAFQQNHVEALAAQQSAARDLAEGSREDVVPVAVSEFKSAVARASRERRETRARHDEQLADAKNADERESLRDAFREEQRAQHREIKAALKQIRQEVRTGLLSGNRRIDPS